MLLALKGQRDQVRFEVVDVTKPRDPKLLAKTGGSTVLPIMQIEDGTVLRESLVILQYLDERFAQPPVRRTDPRERAIENLMTTLERDFVNAGYSFVMNQKREARQHHLDRLLASYAALDAFLVQHAPHRTFLWEEPGWVECVFTPMFMRFWFVDYYEDFALPDEPGFARVRKWREACLALPFAQQVSREEIVKLYYDYAMGMGNGALPPGRTRSSFEFEPHWSQRPWPPKDKYGHHATDAELGLLR